MLVSSVVKFFFNLEIFFVCFLVSCVLLFLSLFFVMFFMFIKGLVFLLLNLESSLICLVKIFSCSVMFNVYVNFVNVVEVVNW